MSYIYDIFLSHNGADKPWTEKLAYDIESNTEGRPLKVFFDKWDIKPGANLPEELEKGLTGSRFLGLVMSPQAFKSDWVALERSTAIMRDPAAKLRTIIPLLRKPCNIPSILTPLIYIDFTNDNNYNETLQELVNVLRDKDAVRGGQKSFETVYLQEDKRLLENHLTAFERPAFRTSCIWELFLRQLNEAIDDTQAALNTGKLFRRDKTLVDEYSKASEFKTKEFKDSFKKIAVLLSELKTIVTLFGDNFYVDNPDYKHHDNFYAMLMDLGRKGNKSKIRKAVADMDLIDTKRNEIIIIINNLLAGTGRTLDLIELSSDIIKRGYIGGADLIAKHIQ
ncbi:toll/interleukin-1 receptor domain-containing protein [Adhaeribacter radiodurans]|uniref:Toll/interleukin-1 receptor domain-containing protein n=1 Tax=Adhaeribacter radiodurans TaxID=2745197 RepID=A0A7L7LCT3_9BACT|nr:toll/interleukin-1 receptor domain-containing protein [Adhaeribacter radiodurans]QMU30648.1 toll/interleukin-1 receptor domain-containing protein [Adhaeribacter radiodurans]